MDQLINTQLTFLGRGLGFPPTFDKKKGDIQMVEAEIDIQQSLEIILSTLPGERVLQSEFGCNLDHMIFEPLNLTLITYMKTVVRTALILHEPRIALNEVNIQEDNELEGQIFIHVDYTIRGTNSRFNFVYPFYLQEGTDI